MARKKGFTAALCVFIAGGLVYLLGFLVFRFFITIPIWAAILLSFLYGGLYFLVLFKLLKRVLN